MYRLSGDEFAILMTRQGTDEEIIEKAKLLLADDSRLVRDIGQDVGFLTIQNFMRVFKAKTGVTPSEYRSTLPKNS